MTEAQRIAQKFGMTLSRMLHSDTRRIINHESLPYCVVKDGRVIGQFRNTRERQEWLEQHETLREMTRIIPKPKPEVFSPEDGTP